MKNKSELKAYEFRIYPTKEQEQQLLQSMGLCRLMWNLTLAKKNIDYSYPLKTYKQIFTELKPEALEWLKTTDSDIYNSCFMDLKNAFNNFFNSCKGKRKGKFVKPPKFKSRKDSSNWTVRYTVQKPKFVNGKLFFTKKLGYINGVFHRFCEGKIRNCTIRKTVTNKWFVEICVEKKRIKKNHNGKCIAIDWNCNDENFMTLSNGTKIKCPRFLKRNEKHLAHLQRLQAKRITWEIKNKKMAKEQSNSYKKISHKVALLHEHVVNQRKDWLHKLSRKLCNEYEYIIVENINLQTMAENDHGVKVGDQGFGMFRQFISYKGTLIKVDPAYTSKTCHNCGYINSDVVLGIENWVCPVCGKHHDRDINAAKNILSRGVKQLHLANKATEGTSGCNASGEPSSSMKEENSVSSGISEN